MGNIVHFDVAAVIMLLIMFVVSLTRKSYKGTRNRIFQLLIVTTMLGAVFNVITAGLENYSCTNDVLLYSFKTLYLIFHNFATPVYVMYIVSLTRTWHKFKKYIGLSVLASLPYVFVIGSIIVTPFTGFLYSYNNGVFDRKPVMILIYIVAAFYLILGVYYVVRYRRIMKKKTIVILLMSVPLMILAILLKFYFPNSLVEIFSNAVSLMIISMTIQNPDKNIDAITGLKKYSVYGEEIRTDFENDKHQKIICINFVNYEALKRLLGYDGTNAFLRKVAEYLMEQDKQLKVYSDIYYLDQGRFRMVVNSFNLKKAEALAKAVNDASKLPVRANGVDISAEAVVCLVDCPEDIKDFKSLMIFGNDFHDRVQRNGELLYASDLFKQRDFQLMNAMEDIIKRGLEKKSFEVYYQPIYSIDKKRFVSAEALLRLIDDEYGYIPPNLFIPVAEKNGAIIEIGNIVLEKVCRFIASDRYKQLNLDYIEINLSVVQCMQRGLADDVLAMIEKYNISPQSINLEITETAANYKQSVMMENMNRLIAAGISFSLDDFGTGYSNMARVASLPLKIVKLDKTFVDNSNKPKLHIFLKGTIKMLKDMDMEIVVEGIENEQMVETFSQLNCDYIQGYFYSKPIPEKDFVKFIQQSYKTA